jgi:hypothetical protein
MTEKLMLATLISDWFSVAGYSERENVNTFYLQHIVTYFFSKQMVFNFRANQYGQLGS